MTSSWTSSIMAEKNSKSLIYYNFSHFTSLFGLAGVMTWKVFNVSCSNLLYMLLINSSRASLIMAEKKFKMADLLWFFAFYCNNLTCVRDNLKSFSCILPNLLCLLLMISFWKSSITAEKKINCPNYCFFVGAITMQIHEINKCGTWNICVIYVRNKQCDKDNAIYIKY